MDSGHTVVAREGEAGAVQENMLSGLGGSTVLTVGRRDVREASLELVGVEEGSIEPESGTDL
jgi:hypothetical protein